LYRAILRLPRRPAIPRGDTAETRERGDVATVYVIAQISIHDRPRYERYVAGFMPVLKRYGGQLLAADEQPELVEGQWARATISTAGGSPWRLGPSPQIEPGPMRSTMTCSPVSRSSVDCRRPVSI
jgi:hypothetical protein